MKAIFATFAPGLFAAIWSIGWMPATASAGEISIKPVDEVVELFTSQGCSSCPPADRILSKLSHEPGILALSYHVDYWDYIGWQDTLGSRDNTARQRAYAKSFGTSTIYTPQMIVNGRGGVVGSHEGKIRSLLQATSLGDKKQKAKVELKVVGDRLHISGTADAAAFSDPMPVLMLITFDDEAVTEVTRGENSGHTLVNTHPVRDWRILGMWSGTPMEVDIPLSMLTGDGTKKLGCAALLQSVTRDGTPGPIIAAAQLEFEDTAQEPTVGANR